MDSSSSDKENPFSGILAAASSIDSVEEQEKFLLDACSGDDALLREVRSLLPFVRMEKDLERLAKDHESLVGKNVGKYTIQKEIGRGGMGIVYLGSRKEDFHHLAAIKVIRQSGLATEDLRRLLREMKIVAALNHSNIARVIDGGITDTNLPYFIMDYVSGCPIDEYCDKNRLSVRERLQLFRKVCVVVEYFHSQGVIHRDIKPSNILITDEGEPKIIDFGIAHVINSAAMLGTNDLTNLLQRAFSRDYASPEQARGERSIKNSTDIYSLGAVLYEIISGHRPHRFTSDELNEIMTVICENEIVKPSRVISNVETSSNDEQDKHANVTTDFLSAKRQCTARELRRALSGDVDAIIMTALRKEPRHRYQTVSDFISDLDKSLHGKPIVWRSHWWYLFRRKIERFFEALPPSRLSWQIRASLYTGLILILLTAWQFTNLRRWVLATYITSSERVKLQSLTLSPVPTEKTKTATKMLLDHLTPEVTARKSKPNAWTMGQMVISMAGKSELDRASVERFFSDLMVPECSCWREGAESPKDIRVSAWVLIGMSRLGLVAKNDQIKFVLDTIQPDGWWAIYVDYPGKVNVPTDSRYASTYATALAVLALQSQLQRADSQQQGAIREAVARSRNWLMKTRPQATARWWDYPFNPSKSESIGISGLVLHVLHRTATSQDELVELDRLWLDDLPELKMDAQTRENSSVTINPFNIRDPSSQFLIPWSMIATVDAYPNGTSWQRAYAMVWMEDIAKQADALAQGVIGDTPWIAAELLIALRHLQGDSVV